MVPRQSGALLRTEKAAKVNQPSHLGHASGHSDQELRNFFVLSLLWFAACYGCCLTLVYRTHFASYLACNNRLGQNWRLGPFPHGFGLFLVTNADNQWFWTIQILS